jgi:hypothetical protein
MTVTETALRTRLVSVALDWQQRFGVAPQITNTISEYDAARLIGNTDDSYSADCIGRTAVSKGADFTHNGLRYQVKGSRPSGAPGSNVTKLAKPGNYDWDCLVWLLYDKHYVLQEAWLWEVDAYRHAFHEHKYIRPPDMRRGRRIFPPIR